MESFYNSYPLTKRLHPLPSSANNLPMQTLNTNIMATTSIISSITNNQNTVNHTHLQEHLDGIKRGDRLRDGVDGLQIGSIIAVQPSRSNSLPWFAKVIQQLNATKLSIMWLNDAKGTHTQYYYLEDDLDTVSTDAVICNGVEFEPVFGERLLWRLLTPIAFITAMNNDNIPTIQAPLMVHQEISKPAKVDLTSMVFSSATEFEQFLCKYANNKV